MLSLNLQGAGGGIVSGINGIFNSMNKLSALSKQELLHWPTVTLVIAKVNDEGTQKTYEGCVSNNYN